MTELKTSNSGVVIVGAGPAGIAAAVRAAECGKQVTLVDDNPAEGGQIWRGGQGNASTRQAAKWFTKLRDSGASIRTGARIIAADPIARTLRAETSDSAFDIDYGTLILATGARELFLPFPGWTLPNVMGCGGLQGLVKAGLPVQGKRIVVAGSGPLLLAVASQLRNYGASVQMVVEQAGWGSLVGFGLSLGRRPGKLWQALALKVSLGSTPYLPGSWVRAAEGVDQLNRVPIQKRIMRIARSTDHRLPLRRCPPWRVRGIRLLALRQTTLALRHGPLSRPNLRSRNTISFWLEA